MAVPAAQVDVARSLYQRTLAERKANYLEALSSGIYRPIVYPRDGLAALLLFIGILIFPRLPVPIVRYLRIPVVSLIFVHCFYVMKSCRNIGMAGGYGIGLACAWGCIMTVNLLLIDDIKDFQRLETRLVNEPPTPSKQSNGWVASATGDSLASDVKVRNPIKDQGKLVKSAQLVPKASSDETYELVWQRYPSAVLHSLEWSIDLMTAFRGVNWNFRIPTLAPLRPQAKPSKDKSQRSYSESTPALGDLQRKAIISFLVHYLLFDLLKSIWVQDPYFLGLASMSSPHPLLMLREHPIATRWARLLLSMASVYGGLTLVFTLCPLFFATLLPLLAGQQRLLQYSRIPFLEPSMYPSYWKSPMNILDKGLASLWGKVWHQMFRFGISEPSRFLIDHLQLDQRSITARATQLLVAFGLTGFIHAMASYTSFPPAHNTTRPLTGPFLFFIIQALGILLQRLLSIALRTKHLPSCVRKLGNLMFVIMWAYYTGPLLANDFARGGTWLYEPLPISFFRGVRGEGWWHWGTLSDWVGIWTGEHWWEYGLAIC